MMTIDDDDDDDDDADVYGGGGCCGVCGRPIPEDHTEGQCWRNPLDSELRSGDEVWLNRDSQAQADRSVPSEDT